jgi:hypothetical protein
MHHQAAEAQLDWKRKEVTLLGKAAGARVEIFRTAAAERLRLRTAGGEKG